MDIHLRETLCLRNSGRNCPLVEHFKPRFHKRPQVTVFLCRDSVVPPVTNYLEEFPTFLPNRILLCVDISTPVPQLSPRRLCGKMPLPRTKVHVAMKKRKSQQPKTHCDHHSAITYTTQSSNYNISGCFPDYYFS